MTPKQTSLSLSLSHHRFVRYLSLSSFLDGGLLSSREEGFLIWYLRQKTCYVYVLGPAVPGGSSFDLPVPLYQMGYS